MFYRIVLCFGFVSVYHIYVMHCLALVIYLVSFMYQHIRLLPTLYYNVRSNALFNPCCQFRFSLKLILVNPHALRVEPLCYFLYDSRQFYFLYASYASIKSRNRGTLECDGVVYLFGLGYFEYIFLCQRFHFKDCLPLHESFNDFTYFMYTMSSKRLGWDLLGFQSSCHVQDLAWIITLSHISWARCGTINLLYNSCLICKTQPKYDRFHGREDLIMRYCIIISLKVRLISSKTSKHQVKLHGKNIFKNL